MEQPKKRILTEEQKAKMQEGRKKAMEARKALKEEEKKATKKEKELNKKTEKSRKEIEKVKNLELELQALQQQKDRIETLKKTQENRAKFRNKMKEFKEEEQMVEMTIKEPEPEPEPEPVINEEQVFKEKAKEMENLAKTKETKDLFKKVTGSFNNQISISDNLKNMVAELRDLIKKNAKHAKDVDNVVKKVVEQKPIEELNIVEMKAEEKYKSQLSSLMRLR